jgi:hypothetical protein
LCKTFASGFYARIPILTPLKNFATIIYFFYGPAVGKRSQALLVCSLLTVCFQFLGSFAKLQKVTVSFVMSVRLYARNNSASTG